jgi:amidase
MIRMGRLLPGGVLRRAVASERRHAERVNRVFADAEVLLMPTVGIPPPESGRWAGKGALRTLLSISRAYACTIAWNYTGQPAASVPLPPDRAGGLPLAGQLVVPPNREDLLLALSAQLEAEIGWPERVPEGYE